MERAIAAKNYSKGGCERIGVHLDDGLPSQNTKSISPFWQSLSVSDRIICCHYTFFDTLKTAKKTFAVLFFLLLQQFFCKLVAFSRDLYPSR